MVWKGIIIKESLKDKSLSNLFKIIQTNKKNLKEKKEILTFYKIEVKDNKKDEFVEKAIKSIKEGYLIHLVKDGLIYTIFKKHMFKFSKGFPELEMARKHGKKIDIPEELLEFEKLFDNPFG